MPSDPTPRTAATARALRERLENHVAEATETGVWDLAGWTATLDDLIALAAAEARPNATAATARERVKAMQRALLMSPRVRDGVWLRDSGHQYRAAEEVLAEFDQALAIPASPAGVAALTPGDFAKALHDAHGMLGYWPDPDVIDGRWEMWGVVLHSLLAIPEAPAGVSGEVKPHTVIYDNVDWCIEHERWELMPGTGPTIIPAPAPLPARGEPMTEPTTEAQAIAWAEHSLERNAAVAALFRLLPDSMFPESFDALMERVVAIETIAAASAGTPAPAPTPSEPVERVRAEYEAWLDEAIAKAKRWRDAGTLTESEYAAAMAVLFVSDKPPTDAEMERIRAFCIERGWLATPPTPSEPVGRCRACGHEAARHRPDTCASCDGLDGPHTGICTGYQPTPATRDE